MVLSRSRTQVSLRTNRNAVTLGLEIESPSRENAMHDDGRNPANH